MDGHKPQMRKRGLDHRVLALVGVEPLQEPLYLGFKPPGSRRFKVNALATKSP